MSLMSGLWSVWKQAEALRSSLSFILSTVGVQRATNRAVSGGPAWNRPLTSMEQQLPYWSRNALEVCMRHTKLRSERDTTLELIWT